MKKQFTIKKITAVFLLCVFTLGITPKKTLHSLLANHTDNPAKSNNGKTPQLNKAGFNCKVDNLVAQSSFTAGKAFIIITPAVFLKSYGIFYTSFFSLPHLLSNLRGPPLKF